MGLTVTLIFYALVATMNPTRFSAFKNIGSVRRLNGQKALIDCGIFMKNSTDMGPQP